MSSDVERVYEALMKRELAEEDLAARRVAAFLGKTTGALYHHFDSLDGFLFAVSQCGFAELLRRVEEVFAHGGDVADVAETFVDFGLDHPEVYRLVFERRYDWDALRAAGAFDGPLLPGSELWEAMLRVLKGGGSKDPETDVRLLWAGLHGMVSLASSGRANVGALEKTDREVARAAARELARRIAQEKR